MVAQNSHQQFAANPHVFFWDKPAPERQRSGAAHSTLRHRSDDAQVVAQARSTGYSVSPVKIAARLAGRPKNLAHPGASCEFLSKSS